MSSIGTHQLVVNVFLLNTAGKVCLFERQHTESRNGYWVVGGGRAEPDEDALSAACREMYEELGVIIEPQDLRFVGAYERPIVGTAPAGLRAMQLFFATHRWQGEPYAKEPEKHGPPQWFGTNELPEKMHELDRAVIQKSFQPFLEVRKA